MFSWLSLLYPVPMNHFYCRKQGVVTKILQPDSLSLMTKGPYDLRQFAYCFRFLIYETGS